MALLLGAFDEPVEGIAGGDNGAEKAKPGSKDSAQLLS
jgi:hypothetical protein